ncbi:MAG: Plastocyanin [Actinomycetia bacterium]|nr:Plastocyanin [Actinomycetes bacterium]
MSVHPLKLGAAVGVLVLVASAAACGSSRSTAASSTTAKSSKTTAAQTTTAAAAPATAGAEAGAITIKNFTFSPDPVTAKVGQQITVKNEDTTAHTVTADDKTFDTMAIPPNGSATFTVTKAGTYPFHCSIHEFMKGTLTVS